jgi:NTE family protein
MDAPSRTTTTGIALAAAGARGAYEAGVLVELLPVLDARGEAPRVLAGASSGAIAAVATAGLRHRPADEVVAEAYRRYSEVVIAQMTGSFVFRQAPRLAARAVATALGLPGGRVPSLIRPRPLERRLPGWLDLPQVHANVDAGLVDHVAVLATDVHTGRPTAFVEGAGPLPPDGRIRYVPGRIVPEHVQASAAIPVVFPPVRIETPHEAAGWYCDALVRISSPVPVARALGADRVVVVAPGTSEPRPPAPPGHVPPAPGLSGVLTQTIDTLLADPLARDVSELAEEGVPHLVVAPSPGVVAGLAVDALRRLRRRPSMLRTPGALTLARLLGDPGPLGGELLSYLLFDATFSRSLIDLGRADTRAALAARGGDPWAAPHAPVPALAA